MAAPSGRSMDETRTSADQRRRESQPEPVSSEERVSTLAGASANGDRPSRRWPFATLAAAALVATALAVAAYQGDRVPESSGQPSAAAPVASEPPKPSTAAEATATEPPHQQPPEPSASATASGPPTAPAAHPRARPTHAPTPNATPKAAAKGSQCNPPFTVDAKGDYVPETRVFRSLTSRLLRAWLAALVVLTLPLVAWGQTAPTPPADAPDAGAPAPEAGAAPSDAELALCFTSFSDAQRLRREGKLLDTRRALLSCASDRCPAAIVQKCIGWLGEVARELPSVVVWAQDRSGHDTVDVRVWIDGRAIADRLDGRPVELDPGTHEVVLEHQGEKKTLTVLLTTGEQNRRVGISFAPPPPPTSPSVPPPQPPPPVREAPYRISPLVWVGFSIALAGGVVAGVTGGLALSRAKDLERRCGGKTCTADERADYDAGTRLAHASTACFAIAGAGAVLGVVGILLSGRDEHAAELRAGLGLGTAWLEGRF